MLCLNRAFKFQSHLPCFHKDNRFFSSFVKFKRWVFSFFIFKEEISLQHDAINYS